MTDKEKPPVKKPNKPRSKKVFTDSSNAVATKHTTTNQTDTSAAKVSATLNPKKTTKKASVKGLVLWIVISGINLSGFGYLWFLNQQQNTQQSAEQQQQQEQLDALSEIVQQQNDSIAKIGNNKHQEFELIRQKIEDMANLNLNMQSQLNLTQQQVSQAGTSVNQDLLLTEADFLIRTAAIRLLLTENISETTHLLKAADKKLLKINDVAIFPVRAALTKDLYQLKATSQIDIVGSYLVLENIEKSIKGLKINFILPETQSSEKATKDSDQDWYQHLSSTTENVLTEWFQITHYNEEIKPLVSKQQDIMIKQSVVLLIKQAQWSLIQKNIELYQLSLKSLSEQIASAFNKQDPAVKNARVEIKSLLSESIVTPVSKYLHSEKAMKVYLDASTVIKTQ